MTYPPLCSVDVRARLVVYLLGKDVYQMTKLDYSQIVLDKADYKRLKMARTRAIPGSRSGPLCAYGFAIEEQVQPVPGGMPVGVGRINITSEGKLYLNWRKQDIRRYRLPQWLSVAAIIISIVALIRSW